MVEESNKLSMGRLWLIATNVIISLAWLRVLLSILGNGLPATMDQENSAVCIDDLTPKVRMALGASFLELLNCVIGLTRSPMAAVILFSCTRMGVEVLVAPMIPCGSWQHMLTVAVWSFGDVVRFGCFACDGAFPGIRMVKSIRFTVGPILFPIGALAGEMMMVVLAGSLNDKPILYGAAALWPVFFYPMMKQLLKQRKKHFASGSTKKKEIKAV